MDPVARSVREALAEIGIEVAAAGTYKAWLCPLSPDSDAQRKKLAEAGQMLANEVIEELLIDCLPRCLPSWGLPNPGGPGNGGRVELPLVGLDDAGLLDISEKGCLSLSAIEMRAVQEHFAALGRAPSLTELESLAQTWSEHCKHKTLMGAIDVFDSDGKFVRRYENLIKETIAKVTRDLNRPWCISVFEDNAGVVDFDGRDCLCIKVETHNHPSAIEPFGGAGTGIGGVIRDILGTGLGARPLCSLDVFCVAEPDLPDEDVPPGCLHPARVLDGIVRGVRDYGNPMGIPTVTGAVHFDKGFVGNPLVYCGTVGILPKSKVFKEAKPGDKIIVAGGRTGRDGIHGATFSSVELTEDSEMLSSGAVQIGDPITEKKLSDALVEARDLDLYHAVTDCGAGGLSSAVGEMGAKIGAFVELDKVPLKYEGLSPSEIWISEAQERMVFAVPKDRVTAFDRVFEKYEVETTVIGQFDDSERLVIQHKGVEQANLAMDFLHDGLPKLVRKARLPAPVLREAKLPPEQDIGGALLLALADFNVASKEWITRQYDHEVGGCSVAKPFSGPSQKGPGDGAVLMPKPDVPLGFALATGLNPRYAKLDPAGMAEAALDEAIRNIVVKGGDPSQAAVLDNYCWGNTDDPEQLGALVLATEAVCELAREYGTPFVSGKDSLNNEYRVGDKSLSIPGCLLVTALAPVAQLSKIPDSSFTATDRSVYLFGLTRKELGGSVYHTHRGEAGGKVPRARGKSMHLIYRTLHELMQMEIIDAAHDPSEGGLAVALAEMAFGGEIGLFLDLAAVPVADDIERDEEILFSESLGRILVCVNPEMEEDFISTCSQRSLVFAKIGETTGDEFFACDGLEGERLFSLELSDLQEAFQKPLANGAMAVPRRRSKA